MTENDLQVLKIMIGLPRTPPNFGKRWYQRTKHIIWYASLCQVKKWRTKKSPKRSHGHNNTPILPKGFPWDSLKEIWVLKGHQYRQLLSSKVEEVSHQISSCQRTPTWKPMIFRFVTSPNNISKFYPSQPTQKNSQQFRRTHTHTHWTTPPRRTIQPNSI